MKTVQAGPKVSVVVPNYNYARFLDQRMQSILSQSFADFELIYLDDASTDDSETVIARYLTDSRVRKIVNKVNSGSPFKQWNKGVREARGEYIWIAEADDYADEQFLKTLVGCLDRSPNAGVAYCQSVLVNESNDVVGSQGTWMRELDANRWESDFEANGREECGLYLVRRCTISNASAVVFRKAVFEAAGGANPRLRASGDWLLWVNMLLRSDLVYVSQTMNYFRKHVASVTSRALRDGVNAAEGLAVIRHILRAVYVEPDIRNRALEELLWDAFKSWRITPWHRRCMILAGAFAISPSMCFGIAGRRIRRLAKWDSRLQT